MVVLTAYRSRLEASLAALAGEHRVPGAAAGVLVGDDVVVATTGVANVATGVPVTPDTLFQIGSVTKLYTATLVAQAQAAGVVSLDEPVRAQLQEFMVADPGATIEITPRHLLTHTSGIEGDHLIDTGWNADALQRYVATLAALGQIHPTDESFSFCNTGYAVLGRLLEVATGEDFDRVLRRRLTRPLGCRATLTLPHHALLHSVATGHVQAPGGGATRQGRWVLTRSNGPMGGVLTTPGELLAFVRMHLDLGRSADGGDLLAPDVVEAMQRPHAETHVPGEEQALGWTLRRWGDVTVLAQDADTFGQRAFLRVVPSKRLVLCVMANSPAGGVMAQRLVEQVAADLAEVAAGEAVGPAEARPDGSAAGGHAGIYDRLHQRIEVTTGEDGRPVLATEPSGVLRALGVADAVLPLRPLDAEGRVFDTTDPVSGMRELVVFTGRADRPRTGLYLGGRLHRRTG